MSQIRIPVPPGIWRHGVPATVGGEDNDILLRFATKADKKIPRAEQASDFYRMFGNPNYGGKVEDVFLCSSSSIFLAASVAVTF